MAEHLDELARRMQLDPFFLAAALAGYARSEGLGEAALAARLGCPPGTLTMLRLCRRPQPGARFGREIATIADRFSVSAELLATMVRRADALEAMRDVDAVGMPGAGDRGTLIAARDREPDWDARARFDPHVTPAIEPTDGEEAP